MTKTIKLIFSLILFSNSLTGLAQEDLNLRYVKGQKSASVQVGYLGQNSTSYGLAYKAFLTNHIRISPGLLYETGQIGYTHYKKCVFSGSGSYNMLQYNEVVFVNAYPRVSIGKEYLSSEIEAASNIIFDLALGGELELFISQKATCSCFFEQTVYSTSMLGRMYFLFGVSLNFYL